VIQYQDISVEFWTTAHSQYPAGKEEICERSATHLPDKTGKALEDYTQNAKRIKNNW